MKCKKCKDVIESDTEYCGRCILESVQDIPVERTRKLVEKKPSKKNTK